MCLVGIAWSAHPRYPLIIAGNRDEYHARPAAAADWWRDASHVFAGRDLLAGGSWLGVSRSGRIALVTNNLARPPGADHTASRGHLVRDYLAGATPAEAFVAGVQQAAERYAGFCFIAGDAAGLHGVVSPAGAHASPWRLVEGVWAISNAPLEAPWPKASYLEARLEDLLLTSDLSEAALFALLAHREPVGDAPAPGSTREWVKRTPFIVGGEYGTRASTVILVDRDGGCRVVERRFDPAGLQVGEARAEFELER
jgi:uncharacterized protein with NRDE domain